DAILVNWIAFEIVDAKGKVKYSMAWVTSLPVSKERFEQFEHGVPGEGEQIEGRQRHREKPLAMAEIVFEFVAVVFQHVEALVFDLPTRPAAGDDPGDIVLGDGKAGHPGHGIFDLALGVDNLEAN